MIVVVMYRQVVMRVPLRTVRRLVAKQSLHRRW